MVCETVPHLRLPPPCIRTLSAQSHPSLLHKRGRRFLQERRGTGAESSWGDGGGGGGGGGGDFGVHSSTLNSVGERERPFSVSSFVLYQW